MKIFKKCRRNGFVVFMSMLVLSCNHVDYSLESSIGREQCQEHLRAIWKVAELSRSGGGDRFPLSFQEMSLNYPDTKLYVCPASGHKPGETNDINLWTDYVYVSGLTESDPTNCVLAFCPPEHHKNQGANVLFIDGSVRWYGLDEFKMLTNDPSLFFGTVKSNELREMQSRAKLLYHKVEVSESTNKFNNVNSK